VAVFHAQLSIGTSEHDQLVDITEQVREVVVASGVRDGVCTVYVPHATAAIAINENDDPNVGVDVCAALRRAVPDRAGWLHDRIDGNAASHIKAAIVGPSESIPIRDGTLALGTWQNVFLCEFDGPRRQRSVLIAIVS
jgi:secondary thiamine-phosphate synthase enzyme